jgi:hypothetical protein
MVSITSEPCHYDLTHDSMYPSCLIYPRECHLRSCQSSFQSRSLTQMEGVSIGVELEKVLSIQSIWWNCQMKRIKWSTQHDWSLQHAMSLTHGRKSCMGVHEVFLLPIVLISSFLHGQCIIHYFLVLPYPFINLRTRSLLRGWREGGCNTPCYKNANHLH